MTQTSNGASLDLARLLELPDYADTPLTQTAQAVQISAFPKAYAKHEPLAEALRAEKSCSLIQTARFSVKTSISHVVVG